METNTHCEGKMPQKIENCTSKVPSCCYLTAAMAVMGTSLILKCCKKNHAALFVGQWAAPFLLMGLYNKFVKTCRHEQANPTTEKSEQA